MAVSTVKSSGGDYSSLSAWESAKQAVLSAPEEAECYDFQDTTQCTISGWTTTAANYIRVYTPTAERHNGTSRDVTGSGYQIKSGSTPIWNAEDYVRLEGLDILGQSSPCVNLADGSVGASNDIRLIDCICHDDRGAANTSYNIGANANAILTITNVIVYGNQQGFSLASVASADISYVTVYTDIGTSLTGFNLSSNCVVKNCGAFNFGFADFYSAGSPTGSNNCSSDTTATSLFTSSLASKTAANQFVNVSVGASADFHLKSGSDCEAAGTPIGGITTDIDGDTRDVSTPDIGADEFVAAVGGTTPKGPFGHPFHGPFRGPIG